MSPPPGLAALTALVAPPSCWACRAPLPRAGGLLCPACTRALPWLGPGACPRCALPAHRARGCPAAGAAFERAWAPLAYSGPARRLVTALKVRGALPVAGLMAAHVAANLPAGIRARGAAVVPVPPQRRRRRRRGYDPAGLLAAHVARRLGVPLVACLARQDHAGPQARLGRHARRAPGRLRLELTAPPPPEVLLLDDVHTTGATLDAAARTLRSAGADVVAAITYARTL
jgi:predicted amidophosphoribosyltransferase